jgi:uncharacterized protein YjiS (DUF1127 family)
MIVSPAIVCFFEDALSGPRAGRPALDRIAGRLVFGHRRRRIEEACLELYRADDATMKDFGLTRQHVLRLMAQEFGR